MTKPRKPSKPTKPQPPQPPGLGYSVFSNPYPYNSPEYNAYRKYRDECLRRGIKP